MGRRSIQSVSVALRNKHRQARSVFTATGNGLRVRQGARRVNAKGAVRAVRANPDEAVHAVQQWGVRDGEIRADMIGKCGTIQPFSLTPALSRWEREKLRPRVSQSSLAVLARMFVGTVLARDGLRFSLSLRERAGVRVKTRGQTNH